MADRKLVGMWSGDIYVNGHPRTDDFRLRTAYVLQDDVLLGTLTVEETLYYSVWTRVRSISTEAQIRERVEVLMKMMGIDHIRNSIVGDAMRKGISGGQLKRLCIAVELVSLPDVIFLDEPTSGLDSSISLEVMSAVKNIIGPNKMCISTIHQPSPEVFELFDKLVLMCNGRLVYYGDTKECVAYFTRPQLGYKYQPGSNPAEFVIAVGGGSQFPEGQKTPRQPEELEAMFKTSKYYQPLNITRIRNSGPPEVYNNEQTSFSTQFYMLLSRTWLAKVRDTTDLRAQLVKNVVVGLLVGIVFFNQGDVSTPFYFQNVPASEVNTMNSIMFMNMMYTMIGNLQAIPYLCSQNLVYRRELAANAYSPAPYWLSMLITILPIQLFFHIIYFITMYWLVGLCHAANYFFYYVGLLFFANITSLYMAMWLAAATNSETLAFALFPILFLFLVNFSGFALTLDDVPPFWSWAPYLSFARWFFEGLMVNQWDRFSTDDETDENGNGNILAVYSFDNYDKNNSFGIAVLYIIGFASILYLALLPPRKKLVKLEQGDMTASAAVSFVERKSKTAKKLERSISLFDDPNQLLRDTLLGTLEKPDEDDVLEPQVTYNVEFYRVSSGMLDKADGCNLTFKNVVYSVPNKLHPEEKITLLRGVTGHVHAGEMCALMGASGAGKSTLLDVLAGRKTTGEITGEIHYNGTPELKSSAYVMQDNVHIPLLTVRETIYFAAQLRLPEDWPLEKKEKRVNKILDMLGLTQVQNTIVGGHSVRGISGGQMKRLSIGVEIVNLPNVMFLDEPTTGLDSSISFEVMAAVRNLANQNRTVICTIHQPSHQTFDLFDTLLLMAKGKVIYFGSVMDCVGYFQHSPYQFYYKPHSNPADYVIAVGGSFIPANNGEHIDGEVLANYYETTKAAKFRIDARHGALATTGIVPTTGNSIAQSKKSDAMGEEEEFHDRPYNTSTKHQLKTLLHRTALKLSRDRRATVAATFRHILVALFYGSIYFQLSTGTASNCYTNRLGLFFFSLMFMIIGHQQAVPALIEDRLLFYRERGAKAYGGFTYWLSCWFFQLPMIAVNVMFYSLICYHMVGLRSGAEHFIFFYYILIFTSFSGYFIACFIASVAPSSQAALSYYPIVLFFSIVFSGFLIYLPQFPDWLGSWAPYISFMRYAYQALVLNELNGNTELPNYSIYINNYGFNDLQRGPCGGILILFTFFYGTIFFFAIRYLNFEER